MQSRQPVQQYLKQSIEGMGQGDMIVLLYEAGITFLSMGKVKIQENDHQGAHNALIRAINVIYELMASLNMEKGGEIAKNLLSLYAFINRRIVEANNKKEIAGVDEALTLMTDLKETWRKAVDIQKGRTTEEQPKEKKMAVPSRADTQPAASFKGISVRG